MKISENLAMLFLSAWLILFGLLSLTGIKIPMSIMYVLGIITGILLLISKAKLSGNLGRFLLGIWLIVTGLFPFIALDIPYFQIIMNILAICTGVFILLKR